MMDALKLLIRFQTLITLNIKNIVEFGGIETVGDLKQFDEA